MGIPNAIVGISRIKVYQSLLLYGRPYKGRSWHPLERRGFVSYGSPGTLYITPEGIACRRVCYEETAHSLLRLISLETSDAKPNAQVEKYIDNLLRTAFDSGPKPTQVPLPIRCHCDIFNGFLKSRSFQQSPTSDQAFAKNLVARLGQRCRMRTPHGSCSCAC